MKSVILGVVITAAFWVSAVAAGNAEAATVEVRIHDVASTKGLVMVALCTKDEFMKDCGHKTAAPAKRGDVSVSFPNVTAGDYAVMTFHDENGNARMDRNALGVPTEGGGFSRDPDVTTGAPTFDKSVVKIGPASTVLDVTMTYW